MMKSRKNFFFTFLLRWNKMKGYVKYYRTITNI